MDTTAAPEVSTAFGQTIRIRHFGVILRVHRRTRYLRRILKQIKQLSANGGPRVTILISYDRPTPAVAAEVDRIVTETPNVYAIPAPGALVSSEGLRWMSVLEKQYRELLDLEGPPLDACMLWDDDALFSPPALVELRRHMKCLEYDRLDIRTLFLWNTPWRINNAFPDHWSACLFRVYQGDEFPTDFEVHCPRHCARSERHAALEAPWLNYGYMEPDERLLTFEAQKAAGKIDAHSLCLVRPPLIAKLRQEYRNHGR